MDFSMQELWLWLDTLAALAFNSSEPLKDRAFYAVWWLELAEALTDEVAIRCGS